MPLFEGDRPGRGVRTGRPVPRAGGEPGREGEEPGGVRGLGRRTRAYSRRPGHLALVEPGPDRRAEALRGRPFPAGACRGPRRRACGEPARAPPLPPPLIQCGPAIHSFGEALGVKQGVEGGALERVPVADDHRLLTVRRTGQGERTGDGIAGCRCGRGTGAYPRSGRPDARYGVPRGPRGHRDHQPRSGGRGDTAGAPAHGGRRRAAARPGAAAGPALVAADALTPLPEAGLALVRAEGFGPHRLAPLPISVGRPAAGTTARLWAGGWLDGTVVGPGSGVMYTATERVHLLDETLELGTLRRGPGGAAAGRPRGRRAGAGRPDGRRARRPRHRAASPGARPRPTGGERVRTPGGRLRDSAARGRRGRAPGRAGRAAGAQRGDRSGLRQ